MIVLGPDQERYGGLVEASPLSVPFLDGVECAFPGEVEHKQDSDGIIADQWQHVDELSLPAKIPDGEGNFRVSD